MNLAQLNNKQLGFVKGILLAKEGKKEITVLQNEENLEVKEGIRNGYSFYFRNNFRDSVQEFVDDLRAYIADSSDKNLSRLRTSIYNILDSDDPSERLELIQNKFGEPEIVEKYSKDEVAKVQERLDEDNNLEIKSGEVGGDIYIGRKVSDDKDFDLQKKDESTYEVIKNGKPVYELNKKEKNWECTCTGYKYRKACKHVDALKEKLETPEDKPKRHPRSEMEQFIPELTKICEPFDKWEIVGSWRRKSPDFKDVDVIALSSNQGWNKVHQNLVDSGAWEEFIFGDTLMRGMYHGYYLDFNLCPSEDDWIYWLLYRTGNKDENVELRKRAIQMGYAISEKGIQDRYTFDYVDGINSEEDFYNFFGYEYRKPEERNGEGFKELPNWNIEEHYSEGKKSVDVGDYDWHDYILTSVDKLKDRNTIYREAKYPARLAILVCREIARRTNNTPEFVLSHVAPEEIQPEGFKKGQQTWDDEGNVYTVK